MNFPILSLAVTVYLKGAMRVKEVIEGLMERRRYYLFGVDLLKKAE